MTIAGSPRLERMAQDADAKRRKTKTHYQLPEGMTWHRTVTERVTWDISETFYPVAFVEGEAIAWGPPSNPVDK